MFRCSVEPRKKTDVSFSFPRPIPLSNSDVGIICTKASELVWGLDEEENDPANYGLATSFDLKKLTEPALNCGSAHSPPADRIITSTVFVEVKPVKVPVFPVKKAQVTGGLKRSRTSRSNLNLLGIIEESDEDRFVMRKLRKLDLAPVPDPAMAVTTVHKPFSTTRRCQIQHLLP
jgi:hypothetical protein